MALSSTGNKVIGETEIKDRHGNLLVRFSSEEAESYWGNEYQKERTIYSMRHKRDRIPMYLRTGKKTLRLRILGARLESMRLHKINQKEDDNGRKSDPNSTSISECE